MDYIYDNDDDHNAKANGNEVAYTEKIDNNYQVSASATNSWVSSARISDIF